jgi:hypothetical protein
VHFRSQVNVLLVVIPHEAARRYISAGLGWSGRKIAQTSCRINELLRTSVGLVSRHELLCWKVSNSGLLKKVFESLAVVMHDKANVERCFLYAKGLEATGD